MDVFVPSLPEVMRYFVTTEQVIQWTLSFNFFGFFISSLFCGPLSDALGRRVVLLSGTALFVAGSFFTVTASSVEVFLFGRFIQGIGVSAPAVVNMAIIADLYEGALFVRWTSLINSLITTTMALAPIAGVYLTQHFGWRSNFTVIAGLAALGFVLAYLFVPETLPEHKRKHFHPRSLISNYKKLFTSRKFVYPMIGLCFLVTPYFVFVGIVSLLFIEALRVPMHEYVIYQGSIVAVFAAGSLIVSIFGAHLDLDRLMKGSMLVCALSAGCLLTHGLFLKDSAPSLTILMALFAAGCVVPCTVLYMRAISVYPSLQGSSAALFQSVRMLMLSIGTAIAGSAYNGFYAPIGLITGVSVLMAVVLILPILKEKTNAEDVSRLAGASH
jgi:DHA1 family bicyclomycin/chloramphenicol resistance-like MFS transporter